MNMNGLNGGGKRTICPIYSYKYVFNFFLPLLLLLRSVLLFFAVDTFVCVHVFACACVLDQKNDFLS